MSFVFLHWWLFRNECLVGFCEKRAIDPHYHLGDCPSASPFREYYRGWTWLSVLLYLSPLSFAWVVWFRMRPRWGPCPCVALLGVVLGALLQGFAWPKPDPAGPQFCRRLTESTAELVRGNGPDFGVQ